MSEQIDRLIQIILMLPQEPQAISCKKIQQRLENQLFKVDDRTMQRSMKTLIDAFPGNIVCEPYPTYANRSQSAYFDDDKSYRYYWRKGYKELKLVGLNINQALSLRLVKKYLVSLLPKVTIDDLEPLFTEAAKVLTHFEDNALSTWPDKIAIIEATQPLIHPVVDPLINDLVGQALLSDKQITMSYTRHDSQTNDYALNPIGLVLRNGSHYLIATKIGTQDKRQFALHRINKIKLLDSSVELSENCSLEYCLKQGQMGFNLTGTEPYGMINFKAIFDTITANHLSESRLSEDQTVKKLDDHHYEITATIKETEQLYWWLLSFGSRIEVKEPLHLRNKMAETAKAMLEKYG
ncbi:MAG: WYL domain-containing protein [Methylococcales bacterium]